MLSVNYPAFGCFPTVTPFFLRIIPVSIFFHTVTNTVDALLGKYTDFGGSDSKADKLVFSTTIAGNDNSIVLLYDGQKYSK